MKLQLVIVIGAIIIGSIATVNMALVQDNEFSANSVKSTAGFVGHITLTAVDEDGNIIAYRQTDNTIINTGDDCILEEIFGALTVCDDNGNDFTNIHIGTNTASFTETSTGLGTFFASSAGTVGSTVTASALSGASTTISTTFFDVSTTIEEAALQNSILSASDVLALQQFTGIVLGPNDDLTIDWTVTIDGT